MGYIVHVHIQLGTKTVTLKNVVAVHHHNRFKINQDVINTLTLIQI